MLGTARGAAVIRALATPCSTARGPSPSQATRANQQAALFSGTLAGMAKNTYGTGCFLLLNYRRRGGDVQQQPADDDGVATGRGKAAVRAGRYFTPEGSLAALSCNGCATACAIKTAADVEALAAEVPGSRRFLPGPALPGLWRCRIDQHTPAAQCGLTGSGITHIARAALESIAFQSVEVLAAMEKGTQASSSPELRVVGATANNPLDADSGGSARRTRGAAEVAGKPRSGRRLFGGPAVRLLAMTPATSRRTGKRIVSEPIAVARPCGRDDGGLGAGGRAEQGLGTLTPAIDQLSPETTIA